MSLGDYFIQRKVPKKTRGMQKTWDERWMKDGARRRGEGGGGRVLCGERSNMGVHTFPTVALRTSLCFNVFKHMKQFSRPVGGPLWTL